MMFLFKTLSLQTDHGSLLGAEERKSPNPHLFSFNWGFLFKWKQPNKVQIDSEYTPDTIFSIPYLTCTACIIETLETVELGPLANKLLRSHVGILLKLL